MGTVSSRDPFHGILISRLISSEHVSSDTMTARVSDAFTRPALRFRATSRYKLVMRTATRAGAIQVESGSSAVDSATKDPLMLRTIRGEKVERPPIWMMRQAGRYMKIYQDLCKRHPHVSRAIGEGGPRSRDIATAV